MENHNKLISALFFIFLPVLVFSQQNYGQGIWNLNAGIGFPNTTHTAIDAGNDLFGLDGENNGSSTPFYNLSANYGITENIELGIYTGYFESDSEIISILSLLSSEDFGEIKYTVFSVGGRATIHEQIIPNAEKLDTYASTFFGYNFVNDKADLILVDEDEEILGININDALTRLVSNANFPEITYEVNAGARYRIGEQSSVFLEAGYGRFFVNAGFNFTLP